MGLTATHEDVLRALQAIDLCAQVIGSLVVAPGTPCPCPYCSIRRVDASYLDAVQAALEVVRAAGFVGESGDVDLWDKLLDLPVDSGLTPAQRRTRIMEFRRKAGGLSKAYFLELATEMGYAITIDRGIMPLRAGLAKAGDALIATSRLTAATPSNLFDLRNGAQYPVALTPTGLGALGAESAAAHIRQPTYPADFWTWVVNVGSLGLNADSSRLKARFEALKPAYSTIVWRELWRLGIDGGVGSLAGSQMLHIDGQVGSIAQADIPHYDY